MKRTKLALAACIAGSMTSLSLAETHTDKQQTINPEYLRPGETRIFSIEYTGKVLEVPAGTKKLRVGMPVPQDSTVQSIRELTFSRPPQIASEPKYGNQIAYWEFDQPEPMIALTMKFVCARKEAVVDLVQLTRDGEEASTQFDCSEASRFASRRQFFFGGHTSNRVTLSTGRDILLEPKQSGEPLNYFLNPYAEADGNPVKTEKTWSYRDLN